MPVIYLFLACEPAPDLKERSGGGESYISSEHIAPVPNISFYSFRTSFDPSGDDRLLLELLQPEELVFRLFDVDEDQKTKKAVPVSPLRISKGSSEFIQTLKKTKISGLVFITNRTLKGMKNEDMQALSEKIIKKTEIIVKNSDIQIQDLQMDCDWTASTKEKYFMLLNFIRADLRKKNISLTATIRLHQIKYYKKTGIPPADRGVLMFYNMTDPGQWETNNSILDLNAALKYTDGLKEYPLTLDLALPLYSQAVIFSGGRITGLISGDVESQLLDESCYERTGNHRYRAKKRCLIENGFGSAEDVAAGSLIRYEKADGEVLLQSLRLLLEKRKNIRHIYIYDLNLALFHKSMLNNIDLILPSEQYRNRDNKSYKRPGQDTEGKAETYYNKKNIEILQNLSAVYNSNRSFPVSSGL